MRSHLGVLALEKPGTPEPTPPSRESDTPEKENARSKDGDTRETNPRKGAETIPDRRVNKPVFRAPFLNTGVTESKWPQEIPQEDSEEFDEPANHPPVNWRAALRHTSVIIAIPLFTFVMATLYTRGLFKSNEPPGTWLLMIRQSADQDWCFHVLVVLFFLAAILMVGKKLTYGFYVLSVAWSVLFIRNL
jgi:hypothetical protein